MRRAGCTWKRWSRVNALRDPLNVKFIDVSRFSIYAASAVAAWGGFINVKGNRKWHTR